MVQKKACYWGTNIKFVFCTECNSIVYPMGSEWPVHSPCTECTKKALRECKLDDGYDNYSETLKLKGSK